MVFEVMLIEEPTVADADQGKLERVVAMPMVYVAGDAKAAERKALLDNATALAEADADRVRVLTRPFAPRG